MQCIEGRAFRKATPSGKKIKSPKHYIYIGLCKPTLNVVKHWYMCACIQSVNEEEYWPSAFMRKGKENKATLHRLFMTSLPMSLIGVLLRRHRHHILLPITPYSPLPIHSSSCFSL